MYLFFCIKFFFVFVKQKKKHAFILSLSLQDTLKKQSNIDFKNLQLKDIDTIPGIRLNRLLDSLLINKKGKKIIVAVIDMFIEINHIGFVDYIWTNKK